MLTLTPHDGAWGFVCGRVSVSEGRLLSPEFLQTLVSHARPEDVLRQLNETMLREFVRPDAGWEDWSGVIDRFFTSHLMSIRHDCPSPEVVDLFLIRNDYLNLKRAIVGLREYPFPELYLTTEHLSAVASGDVSGLPEPFKTAATRALEVLEQTHNQAYVDLILDSAYLSAYYALVERIDAPLITEYAHEYILSRAVLSMWRLNLSGIDVRRLDWALFPMGELSATLGELAASGGPKHWNEVLRGTIGAIFREATSTQDGDEIQRFEDLTMNYLVDMARRGGGQVAGPERVFAYLRSLASEAHNLKLIVCGRLSAIDGSVLKQRLRKHHD